MCNNHVKYKYESGIEQRYMNIVFRADASKELGIGHIMRCLALSEELIRRENTCYFLSRLENDDLISRIKTNNINFNKLNGKTTLHQDLETLIKFSNNNSIDWVITDSYLINSDYVKTLKQHRFNVLSIDDTADIHYHSDIVLNQNIGAEKLKISAEKYTVLLQGSKYILMRDELLKREEKKENKKVETILISLGGAEKTDLTLEILHILESITENIEILVVLGPFNTYYEYIKRQIEKSKNKIKLLTSPKNMADVYLEADIAISAGGSSCYELAYFGIPNIIITIAKNQINIAHELNHKKIGKYVGESNNLSYNKLKSTVDELIHNHPMRKMMILNGKKLVDGKGKTRVAKLMERYS